MELVITADENRPLVVLSVENEAIIAYGVADDLAEAGFVVAGPYISSAEALFFLEGARPDLAIIEYRLKDRVAVDLAEALNERGVPFIVFSSWSRTGDVPCAFNGVTWLEKPASREAIIGALQSLRTNLSSRKE